MLIYYSARWLPTRVTGSLLFSGCRLFPASQEVAGPKAGKLSKVRELISPKSPEAVEVGVNGLITHHSFPQLR